MPKIALIQAARTTALWTFRLIVPLALVAPATLHAQENGLQIDGSVRVRFEGIDGQFRPGTRDTGALFVRTLTHAEYRKGPIRIGGELQDGRATFDRQPSSIGTTEVDTLEPIQAYVTAELTRTATLQVGRMTMDLGSRRLVSRQVFRNTNNAFTGARFDWYSKAGDGATLFWVMPQDRLPNDRQSILDNDVALNRERLAQQLFGARGVKTRVIAGASLEGYVYRLTERDAPNFATRDRRLWTSGIRVWRPARTGAFDFEVEAMLQRGKARATAAESDRTDLSVDAYFIHASICRTFKAPWSPRLVLSYDRASGDGPNGKYRRFDTLFGARVFEYGPSGLYGPVGRANLSSPEVRLEARPAKRSDGYVAVRPLWLENATDTFASTGLRDPRGAAGRYAGTQFDTRVRRWLKPNLVRLGVGFSLLAKGGFLRNAPQAPQNGDTRYGFTEVTFSF